MTKYYLGIDIGTTSICALALDTSGKVLHTLNRPNNSTIESNLPFARLQDPDLILKISYELIEQIKEKLGLPTAIGITGQMHGIVYVDAYGHAISPLYTWQDTRGAQPMSSSESYVEFIKRATGHTVSAGYGLVTHFYNIQNGEVPETAKKICTVHDYIALKLAGLTEPVLHNSDAASFGLYDLSADSFDIDAIRALEIDEAILPDVTASSKPIGTYRGVPVYPAIGDNQASFLGSVGEEEGVLLINIGTGSQVSMIGTQHAISDGIECRPFINGKHLLVGSSLCGGRAYAILENFFRSVANMCGAEISTAYPFMDKLMSDYNGERTLSVSTLFDGTRSDPDIRGSITNITTDNLEPAAMMDGFMRGIASELYSLYRKISNESNTAKLIGSGNGLRSNPYLCHVIEETFGSVLSLTGSREEAALGAARFAMLET